MKSHHYKDLKYDWGYSCRICQTWQHQSQLISIQQGYAAKAIIGAIGSEYISYCDGTLEQFVEAAQALDMEYDNQQTIDSEAVASHRASGYDFKAWHPGDEDNEAKICF